MAAATPRAFNPLRAVFFCDVSASAAHHIRTWLEAGHHVAGCVISHRPHKARWRRDRWCRLFAPDWSLRSVLGRANAPLIQATRNLEDPAFVAMVGSLGGAVLISHHFPQRIPDIVTSQCEHGGVNLHPSLLPQYRGPHPLETMVLDRTWHQFGGVTLHRIVHAFDEGDVIAQARLPAHDLANPEWSAIAHARIGAELLIQALPAFCAGQLAASPQPVGTWRYARLTADDLILSTKMQIEDIALRAKVLGPLGKLYLHVGGRRYRIGGVARSHREAAVAAVRVTPLSVEFDACDGRIRLLRENRLLRHIRDAQFVRRLRQLACKACPA